MTILFKMKHIQFELYNKSFNAKLQVMYHSCSKNTIETLIIQSFPVKIT